MTIHQTWVQADALYAAMEKQCLSRGLPWDAARWSFVLGSKGSFQGPQRLQYPLIKEYSLNYSRIPYMI